MRPYEDPMYQPYGSPAEAYQAVGDQCKMTSDVLSMTGTVLAATNSDSLALATREIQTGLALLNFARAPVTPLGQGLLLTAGSLLLTKGIADAGMWSVDQMSVTLGGPHVPSLKDIFFPTRKTTDKVDQAETAVARIARNRGMDVIAKRGGTFARGGALPTQASVGVAKSLADKCKAASDAALTKLNASNSTKDRATQSSMAFDHLGNVSDESGAIRVDKDHSKPKASPKF